MPKSNIDYSLNIIYKIMCKNSDMCDKIFVGRTTDFIRRKAAHKASSKTSDLLLYKTIRENDGWNNWEMIIVEEYPCANSNEAAEREIFYINTLQAELNTNAVATYKEEYKKDWYFKNQQRIHEMRVLNKQSKKLKC